MLYHGILYFYVKILSIFIRADMIHWSVLRTSFDPPKKVLISFLRNEPSQWPGLSSFDILNFAFTSSLGQYLKLKKRGHEGKTSSKMNIPMTYIFHVFVKNTQFLFNVWYLGFSSSEQFLCFFGISFEIKTIYSFKNFIRI